MFQRRPKHPKPDLKALRDSPELHRTYTPSAPAAAPDPPSPTNFNPASAEKLIEDVVRCSLDQFCVLKSSQDPDWYTDESKQVVSELQYTCSSQRRCQVAKKLRRQQSKTAVYKKSTDQLTSATDNRRTEEQFRIACE